MSPSKNEFAVFVKPWKNLALPELAKHIRKLGFDLIELPVRPGFPCQPERIEQDLPQAISTLADFGVRVLNVTAALPLDDERLYAACAKAGISLNRVMFERKGLNYWAAEAEARRALDSAAPLCERYGVKLGVQNHSGAYIPVNELGLYHLVKDYDPRHVGAIWDPAHNALEGMEPESALDVVASHLAIVNLKNAYWQRTSGPEAEVAAWRVYWTSGRQGRASWPRLAARLKHMNYQGPLCFSAEYTAEHDVDRLIVEDLAFARTLFMEAEKINR
jgi:sugar phosphate isomerase/epimerase